MKWKENERGITCEFDLRGSSNLVTISPHVYIYKEAEGKVREMLGLGTKIFMPKGALKSLIVLSEKPPSDWNPDGMSQVASDYKPEDNSQCAIDSEYDFDPRLRRKKKQKAKSRVEKIRASVYRRPPARLIQPEVPNNQEQPDPWKHLRDDVFEARTIRPPEASDLRIESKGQHPDIGGGFSWDPLQVDMIPEPAQPIQAETLRAPEEHEKGRPSVAPQEPATKLPGPAKQPDVPAVSEQQHLKTNLRPSVQPAPHRPSAPVFASPPIYPQHVRGQRYSLPRQPASVPPFLPPNASIFNRSRELMDTLRRKKEN